MSKNVNVFIGVLLCAVLCGTFVWLSNSGDESSWSPNDIYNEVQGTGSVGGYATTSATFSGSSNEGGVALPMSSSSMRARTSYKYAGAYSGAAAMPLTSNLSPLTYGAASGAGLHLTSSAEIKSFGGGGNGGAAMSYSQSPIANRQSNSGLSNPSLQGGVGISPIAYSTARRGGMSSAAGEDLAMMAAENPVMAMTNATNTGMSNGFYGGYIAMDYSGSANDGQYTGMFGGGSHMGAHGRQNADVFGDAWWVWFNTWATTHGSNYTDGEGNYYFDESTLRQVYNEFLNSFWNSGMGDEPEFEDWLEWYQEYTNNENGYGYNGNNYYWGSLTPVGDILPLLLIALLYVLFVAVNSKSLKSLLKTERSE